jgi:hypothetical protein
LREAYRVSEDVEEEVEECLRLGREADPEEARASSVRVAELFFRKLQERGEIGAGEDPLAMAERAVSGSGTHPAPGGWYG